ncbi:MAG TPA: YceD family protein [Kineosporiaceae bacterium]|nr:YceD family protein [Kineosporiaceae bacterium]
MAESVVATPSELTIHLDPRSPLVLDTRELARRPGTMRKVSRVVPAPADLGTEVIGVPEGSDLSLDLRLESVMEGVLVSGTVRGRVAGECVRCLGDLEQDVEVEVQELFAYPDREYDEDDDVHQLVGDLIDFEPVLRDTVVPALPFQPVCREDCPGLCSECGASLAEDPGHHHDAVDPRWAALSSVLDDQTMIDRKKES